MADPLAERLTEGGLTVQRTVATRFEQFEVTMFRFLDVPGFFAALVDVLQKRVAEAGDVPDVRVALDCRSGRVAFACRAGDLSTGNEMSADVPTAAVSDAELLELVLGTKQAGDVSTFADLPAAARRLLAALFPGRPVVFWLPDHF